MTLATDTVAVEYTIYFESAALLELKSLRTKSPKQPNNTNAHDSIGGINGKSFLSIKNIYNNILLI